MCVCLVFLVGLGFFFLSVVLFIYNVFCVLGFFGEILLFPR